MKKQLIALISCILLLFASLNICVYAKPVYSSDDKVELLYELGILDSKSESKITLKSYLKMLSILSGAGGMEPMTFGTSMNMLKGDENEKNAVTVSDAVKYSVIALGYKFFAEQSGGDATAYNSLAAKLKLTDGITVSSKQNITFKEAVQLIYNMLDVTPVVRDFGSANAYKEAENETMLSLNRKIYKISGIVTAIPNTSIYKEEGCSKNCIEIDMNSYKVKDGKNFNDFLGKRVEAYISADGDKYLLYMIGDNNKEVTIDAEDIISAVDGIIKYKDYSKVKTIKCEFPPKVIVNGRFFSGSTDADFMPSIGRVKFIDNDDDGKSEIIIIEDYNEVILVSRNPFTRSLVYKKVFSTTEETKELANIEFQIYKNGKEITISELNVNDILLIKESRDKKAIIIEASDLKLEGKIQSWNLSEKELNIDGTDYAITSGLVNKINNNMVSFEIGEKYKLFLNTYGDIADAEPVPEIDYYLFFRAKLNRGSCILVYMDTNNEWHEANMCDKVVWEDVKCSSESVVDTLKSEKPQLAKIKFNSKGEVREIKLSTETSLPNKNKFTRTPAVTNYYYSAQRTINYELFAEKGAMVLQMPTGGDVGDKTLYEFFPIESKFRNDKQVSCKAYDIDEFRFSKMFTIEMTSTNVALSDNYFLVTRIRSTLLEDTPTTELIGMVGRFSNFSYLVKDPAIVSSVKKGDLIRFHLDKNGHIDAIDNSNIFHLNVTSDSFSKNWKDPKNALISGKIEAIDLDKGCVRLNFGGSSKTMLLVGTKSVIKYNTEESTVRTSDFSDLRVGDCIVMITNTERKITALYCIE